MHQFAERLAVDAIIVGADSPQPSQPNST